MMAGHGNYEIQKFTMGMCKDGQSTGVNACYQSAENAEN